MTVSWRRDIFIPAAAFQESRPGYEFKNGVHGLGYYAEEVSVDEGSHYASDLPS
jgi:hypothetical protein